MIGQQADHPSAAPSGSEEPDGQAIAPSPARTAGRSRREGVVHLGQSVRDAVLCANPVEDVDEGVLVTGPIGEPDAVVGRHRVDAVGPGQDQVAQELRRLQLARAFDKADEGELAGAVASRAYWPSLLGRSDQPSADGRSPRTGAACLLRSAPRRCRCGHSRSGSGRSAAWRACRLRSPAPVRLVTVWGDRGLPCGGTHVADIGEVGPVTIRYVKARKNMVEVAYELAAGT